LQSSKKAVASVAPEKLKRESKYHNYHASFQFSALRVSSVINSDSPNFSSITHSIARGATWMVAMRWTIRLIGLVNTVILARILTPGDFGLVAMATVAIGLLDAVSAVNVDLPLIRNRAIGRAHYDSAWTLLVLSGLVKSGLYFAVAPLLVKYY